MEKIEIGQKINSKFGKLLLTLAIELKNGDRFLTFETENGFVINCYESKLNILL